VLASPVRPQRARPAGQVRLAHHQSEASHLQQPPRLPLEGRRPGQLHQPAERRRVPVRQHQGLTLRRRRASARVPLRSLELEKSVGKPDQRKQNLQAAGPEKSGVREPGRRKQSPQAAVLNFRENPLGQPGNLHPKQQAPVKEPGKEHKHGLTESQKGPRARLLHRNPKSENSQSVVCANSPAP
jgi:hypothetical protein